MTVPAPQQDQQQDPLAGLPQPNEMPAHLAGLSDQQYDPARDPRVTPEPEAAPQQAQQTPADDQQAAHVPSYRLREETEKRQTAETELQQLRERQTQLTDRFSMLQEAIQGQQQERLDSVQDQPLPDPKEDLQAYVLAVQQKYETRDQQREREIAELKQDKQQQAQISAVRSRAQADQDQFLSKAPDFQQAYNWYRNQQLAELSAMGVDANIATQHVDTMELQLSAAAQQRGRNTAEIFYNAAVARGWRAPQQQTQQQIDAAQQQMAAPASQAQVTPIAQHPQYATNQGQPQAIQPQAAPQQQYQPHGQTLQNINDGMLHSRTLDEAPPSSAAMPMSLDRFANMSDAEFGQYAGKVKAMMAASMR